MQCTSVRRHRDDECRGRIRRGEERPGSGGMYGCSAAQGEATCPPANRGPAPATHGKTSAIKSLHEGSRNPLQQEAHLHLASALPPPPPPMRDASEAASESSALSTSKSHQTRFCAAPCVDGCARAAISQRPAPTAVWGQACREELHRHPMTKFTKQVRGPAARRHLPPPPAAACFTCCPRPPAPLAPPPLRSRTPSLQRHPRSLLLILPHSRHPPPPPPPASSVSTARWSAQRGRRAHPG